MAGFVNDANLKEIVYCDNVDFSGNAAPAGQMVANGQLLIGSTAFPNIKIGTLNSPNANLNIGYSAPNITIQTAGPYTPTTFTLNSILLGAGVGSITTVGPLTNGQLVIGSTGVAPVAAALTAGTGISIANAAGSITINSIGGGFTWNDITGTSASMAINNGYLADNAGLVTLTLPATAVQFSAIAIAGIGAGGWTIAQNANQKIIFGSKTSTTGVGGSLASTNANDCVHLLATVGGASTTWTVLNAVGNITVT